MWALLAPVVSLVLAWLIGNALTDRWDARKKRRELDLAALTEFYRLYGEFFAIWKLWSDALSGVGPQESRRTDLLDRAAIAEGQLEALLVRIASERHLNFEQQHILGAYRQAFKRLRKAIQAQQSLEDQGWSRSGAIPYAAFKGLASAVAVLLSQHGDGNWLTELWSPARGPSAAAARSALRRVTDNVYESGWLTGDGRHMNVWMAVAVNLGLTDGEDANPSDDPIYVNEMVFSSPHSAPG